MARLQTAADVVVLAVISLVLVALGLALMLSPRPALPTDPQAYRAVSGVLRSLRDESPRKGTRVVFTIDGHAVEFVSTSPPARSAAPQWVVGRTRMAFHVLRSRDPGARDVPAFGLAADGRPLRSLQDDLQFHNATASRALGLLPLGIGALGWGVLGFRLRQRRKA